MRRMCSSSVSWYAIVACVILFLSILASIQCLPLDNSPSAAMLHRKSSLMDRDADEAAADFHNYHHGSMDTRTTHNFYWWQIVERASGVQEVESLDREKRFPRIPMNTRCSGDNDCASTHCCAMKLGMPVCRRRPVLEERCQDWTPLDTNALFSLCPCAEGFQCRRIPGRNVGVCEATRR